MKSFRVPIAGLMGLVLFSALSFAAFRSLSYQAAVLAFTGMWLMLLAGAVAARYGRHRTFWTGFSVVGGGYALLAFAPGASEQVRPYLLTSTILDEIAGRLELTKRAGWSRPPAVRAIAAGGTAANPLRWWGGTPVMDNYERIGQSVAAIVHGIGGGLFAALLAFLNRRREAVA
jgi:hypothetical protein